MRTADHAEDNHSNPEDGAGTGRAGTPRRRFLRNTGFAALGAMAPAAGLLRAGAAFAGPNAEPVDLVVDATAAGPTVPADFTGVGFERGALNSGNAGVPGYLFSPGNTQVVNLFRNAGIRNLRIGGGTVDQQAPVGTGPDGYTGVDNLFQFAAAAGANVIYSVRLYDPANAPIPGLIADDAAAAAYIWGRYASLLNSFSIGNEVDWHSFHRNELVIQETSPGVPGSAYPSYLADWRNFASAMHAAAPGALFNGPDTGNYGTLTFTPTSADGISWTQRFTEDEAGSGLLKEATQHYYVGASPFDTTAAQAIANMLSADWVQQSDIGFQPTGTASGKQTTYVPYRWLYNKIIAPTVEAGLAVRLTESNDYLTGVPGASDAFASALWALDYMHWWAMHGVSGVNFHNNQWLYTDTITPGLGSYTSKPPGGCAAPGCGNYRVNPKGYGIKAFNLGAQGQVKPVTIAKAPGTNVTAYAIGTGSDLYVTVINKMYGGGAASARVTIEPRNFGFTDAASISLVSSEPGDPSAPSATLGGATIDNDAPWLGRWTPNASPSRGRVAVTVGPASATVVHLHR